jgi:putative MFS transporter
VLSSDKSVFSAKLFNASVVVTALGYLVDMYDFFIFNVVRTPSLSDLGLSGDALTQSGLFVSNAQLAGVLIGSYIWGVLGDKYGRKTCMFGSILTYSLATIFCAGVQSVDAYALARFIAGFGIAGELGMGVTLISEKLTSDKRGHGVAMFIGVGYLGVLVASLLSNTVSWRMAYVIGGGAGLGLFFARMVVFESGLYTKLTAPKTQRGGFRRIWKNKMLLRKYCAGIAMILPATFMPQIIWTLSPELAKAQGLAEHIKASTVLAMGFACAFVGTLLASFLGGKLRSRKKALILFYIVVAVLLAKYLLLPPATIEEFYALNCLLGLSQCLWMIGIGVSAEQVGTNIRATVTTTTPNFSRGLAILMNLSFGAMKPIYGSMTAVTIIGSVVFILSLWGWFNLDETFGKSLDYENE